MRRPLAPIQEFFSFVEESLFLIYYVLQFGQKLIDRSGVGTGNAEYGFLAPR
jgi:hypothetical protein